MKKIAIPIALVISFLAGTKTMDLLIQPELEILSKKIKSLNANYVELLSKPILLRETDIFEAELKIIDKALELQAKGAPDNYIKEQYVELINKRLSSIETYKKMSKAEDDTKRSSIIQRAEKLLVDIEFGR